MRNMSVNNRHYLAMEGHELSGSVYIERVEGRREEEREKLEAGGGKLQRCFSFIIYLPLKQDRWIRLW